jgi:hypothetical protein
MNPLLAIKRFLAPREEKERIAELKALIQERCAESDTELPPKAREKPKELEEVFGIQADEDFFFGLVDRSLYTLNNIGRNKMPEGEKVVELIYCYRFEANGGGTTTYLSNDTGDDAERLYWAFEVIGEPNLAKMFKKIKKAFPRGVIPADRVKRCDHMELWEGKFEKLCNAMDDQYFELEDSETDNLVAKAARWARANRNKFDRDRTPHH